MNPEEQEENPGEAFGARTEEYDATQALLPQGEAQEVPLPDITRATEVAGAGLTDVNLMERFHAKYGGAFILGDNNEIMVYHKDFLWRSEDSAAQIRAYVSAMNVDLVEELNDVIQQQAEIAAGRVQGDAEQLGRQRDGIIKMIQRCGKGATIHTVASLLMDRLRTIHASNPRRMNPNPNILHCENGVVELDTGRLRWPVKEDLLTKRIDVPYDAGADYSWWEQAVRNICGGSEALYEFLHTWIGYSATGLRRDHSMVIMFGKGRNGKNVVMDAVAAALGPYAAKLPAGFIESAGGKGLDNNQMFALADMYGARFAHASETGEGGELRASVIKAITGDDTITARQPRGQYFTFPITHKITLATNYKPQTSAEDSALYDRLKLFPCSQRFGLQEEVDVGEAQYVADPLLLERAKSAEGRRAVLRWIVEGSKKYYAKGKIEVPIEIKVQIALHRKAMDYFENFLLNVTEYVGPEELNRVRDLEGPAGGPDTPKAKAYAALEDKLRVEVGTFYKMYRYWCQDQGIDRPKTQIMLARYMTDKQLVWTDDDGTENKHPTRIVKLKSGNSFFWKYIKLSAYGRQLLARVNAKEEWEANNV